LPEKQKPKITSFMLWLLLFIIDYFCCDGQYGFYILVNVMVLSLFGLMVTMFIVIVKIV
jgi:hypothetical protein